MTAHAGPGAILRISRVAKAFGGLHVLQDVSFNVHEGECFGLIGPNGAGKTTLFNVITGFLAPDGGRVEFAGADVTRASPAQRVRSGLVRTFQKSMVFPDLAVRENLALAVRARHDTGYGWWRSAGALGRADEEAMAILSRAGLHVRADLPVCALSYGEQRIVDVLISYAMAPRLLLLDEPTAGLSKGEGEHLIDIVRNLDTRTATILIAHDLDIVFAVCDRVAVLDLGRLIACDTPAAIRAHAGAQAAYLGGAAPLTEGDAEALT